MTLNEGSTTARRIRWAVSFQLLVRRIAVNSQARMIEIPPKFVGKSPVNPEARKNKDLFKKEWIGAQGLDFNVK